LDEYWKRFVSNLCSTISILKISYMIVFTFTKSLLQSAPHTMEESSFCLN